MKSLKKMMAIVIALVMVLGMATSAFAYNINYRPGDGGSGNQDATAGAAADGKAIVAGNTGFTKDDHVFTGWNTAADGTGTKYSPNQVVYIPGADLTLFAQWAQYKITVENTNTQVSINNKPFTAYKLFDAAYTNEATSTTPDVDTAPHSYYLSKSSPFYDGIQGVDSAANDGPIITILKEYFVFTEIPSDSNKVQVTPINDSFTEAQAYELAQKLEDKLSGISTSGYVFTANGDSTEKAVINTNSGGPGYYIVTGSGTNKEDNADVKAAVALTTTDPQAQIKAKLTGTTIDKSIDEGTTAGKKDDDDVKEDTHSVGDTVPYVITSSVPDMTGYENYFYVFNDTLSKGLTYNNDLKIVVTQDNQYVEHYRSYFANATDEAAQKYTVVNEGPLFATIDSNGNITGYTTTSPDMTDKVPDDYAATYKVRNHQFVKYTDVTTLGYAKDNATNKYVKTLTVYDGTANPTTGDYTLTVGTYDSMTGTTLKLVFNEFYNRVNGLTGADITITYSATINDNATIDDNANTNTAELVYSNNPNELPNPKSGSPDEPSDDSPVGITPKEENKTYVSGLKLYKVDGKDNTKKLAGASFKLTGTNVNKLVETTKEVMVKDDNGDYYLLKDGTYIKDQPVSDPTSKFYEGYYDSTTQKYKKISVTSYAYNPVYTASDTGAYVKKTSDSTYELYDASADYSTGYELKSGTTDVQRYTRDISYEVTTDANGVLTFTGLNAGEYTLTETVAPEGYNLLSAPIVFKIEPTYDTSVTPNVINGFKALRKGTADDYSDATELTTKEAEIIVDTILNNAGTELPSTGGIGTTIFYSLGGILLLCAAILLVSKRRAY